MDEKEEGTRYLIGGDFNVRTGEEGGLWDDEKGEEDKEERKRKTKDKKITGKGKKFCKALEEAGWGIVNGCTRGDEEGEWTYVGGRGKTVIDYVISNVESKGEIVEMKVGEEVDSDHLPLIVTIKREGGKRRSCKYGKKKCTRLDWSEEERKIFREKYKEKREKENTTEENWRSFSKELEKTKKVVKKEMKKEEGKNQKNDGGMRIVKEKKEK
ncbi:myb-like protein X [Cardiocondyla obscurior]|uniref:myb-like protein X n=1 Tax=Cardiocondyla obscurior TaxID=286306 RepID=UPI0039657E84